MITTKNNYCVILAGGKGRRLWPCSREQRPKQFIDFFGCGRTQLQQTFDRFAEIVPAENIFVVTNAIYADLARQQLPDVGPVNLLVEPIHRNTAPSAAWATHRISHLCPDANIIITPSDQSIHDEKAFIKDIEDGLSFVGTNGGILTMGIKPTRPEPGYGYIQAGNAVADGVFKVQSFTEKPEREFAKVFVESGEFYWNTGLFLGKAGCLLEAFGRLLPPVLRNLDAEKPNFTLEEENEFVKENFPLYPNLSIDCGIFERSENIFVKECNFGWADLGTWHSIYEAMRKGESDNVVVDSDVLLDNSRNNVIKLPKGKLAVINGLDGFIVAEKDNVLLICKKEDSSSLVRKFVNEVQMKKGEDYV